jgi:hypothetical protein
VNDREGLNSLHVRLHRRHDGASGAEASDRAGQSDCALPTPLDEGNQGQLGVACDVDRQAHWITLVEVAAKPSARRVGKRKCNDLVPIFVEDVAWPLGSQLVDGSPSTLYKRSDPPDAGDMVTGRGAHP